MTPRIEIDLPVLPIVLSTIVAGTALGVLFHFQLFILPFFGSLLGLPSIIGGAILHVIGSLLFITVFGLLLSHARVDRVVHNRWRVAGAGIIYGLVLFVGVFGLLLPILTRIRPVSPLAIPYLPIDALILHLVFGFLLGLTFAFIYDVDAERAA